MGSFVAICLRYSLSQNLWMEILMKLAAVALVTVVEIAKNRALNLCIGITLATAATISLAQPYLQPQINRLHSVCFTSLSIAAVGFAFGQMWLSRVALLLPFLVAAWQLLKPDSSEMLAVRVWQEIEPQLSKLQRGEEIEVVAETFSVL